MNNSGKSKNFDVKSKTELFENLSATHQIQNPHKYTQNTLLAFEKIINKVNVAKRSNVLPRNYQSVMRLIYRGRLVCNQADCYRLTVSESLSNRAISFLNTLANALESSNFKIRSIQDTKGQYIAAIKNNEYFSFKLSEGYKYNAIVKDSKSRSELVRLLYRDKEPVPTGKLTLSVLSRETNISKSWTDGVRLIEDEMPNIILAFDGLVLRQKQRRVEDAVKADQRKEYAKIFRENESKYYAEKSIYDTAIQGSQCFTAHKNLEEYLNCLETQFLKEYGCLNEATRAWFSTVRKVAERVSPISKRLKLLSTL